MSHDMRHDHIICSHVGKAINRPHDLPCLRGEMREDCDQRLHAQRHLPLSTGGRFRRRI